MRVSRLRAIIAKLSFQPFGQFGCFERSHVGFELLQKSYTIKELSRVLHRMGAGAR
jgi:hypothetical protein